MIKIDKMILKAFLQAFVLTLCVVTFILLIQIITQYLIGIMSKDIGVAIFFKLCGYFSLRVIPVSLPLAILFASLMTFGNLGEFFELTAIKSIGVSAWRTMRPVFITSIFITLFSFWFNDNVAPWASLKGYSLLYDITTSKATLNIKEGIFYDDIPCYSIKIDKKYPDGKSLKNIVIYHHPAKEQNSANREVILADSGQMYAINNQNNLVVELYEGNQYSEENLNNTFSTNDLLTTTHLVRSKFKHYKIVLDLGSFGVKRSNESEFRHHEYTKTIHELVTISDSIKIQYQIYQNIFDSIVKQYYNNISDSKNSYKIAIETDDDTINQRTLTSVQTTILTNNHKPIKDIQAYIKTNKEVLFEQKKQWYKYDLELHHKFTEATACMIMFLIGSSLGAILKKGGFGLPVLVSAAFFVFYYVCTIQGDKWVKGGIIWVSVGAWFSNTVLSLIAIYFLKSAMNDSRLFDGDIYAIFFDKVAALWQKY
jgi:lipopolysaccharide export system permease protein